MALQALNRHEAATASYRRALALAPSIAEIHYNAATAHTALKQHHAALEHYEKALAIRPDYVRARTGLASTLQALGRHRESVAHYKTVLDAQPDDAQSRNSLGAGLQMLGRQEEAVAKYRRALALRPDYAEAHNNLGLALQALDRHAEALPCHERALAIAPGYAAAHNNLGSALQALDRHDEALAQYRRALAIRPENASAQANIGLALQEIGRIEDACQAFQRAIELQPRSARFYRNLADCKRFTRDDAQLAAMEALGADVDSLPDDEQRQLHFALGKAFADVGEYDRSFRHLLAGNRLKRQQIVYDEPAVLAEFDRIRMVFSRELMTRYAGLGHPSASPVFGALLDAVATGLKNFPTMERPPDLPRMADFAHWAITFRSRQTNGRRSLQTHARRARRGGRKDQSPTRGGPLRWCCRVLEDADRRLQHSDSHDR